MKPLHIGLATKATSPGRFLRDGRMVGIFSYAVPEFTWDHIHIHKWQNLDTAELADKFDLIFHEDGGWAKYTGNALPVIYYIVDSTLSEGSHFKPRFNQAKDKAINLVLVGQDRLGRFEGLNKPIRRLPYCVNDKLFQDYGLPKTIDVASHMNVGGLCHEGRKHLGKYLARWCEETGHTYQGGTISGAEYAKSFSRAKVVVNWPRVPTNRSHRVLDGMACRACVLTGAVPEVSGETRVPGRDYVEVQTYEEFFLRLAELLENDSWREFAENGHKLIQEHHTWAIRAKELRQIIADELGL